MHDVVPKAIEELQIWFSHVVRYSFRKTAAFNLPVYPESLAEEIREKITTGPFLSAEERIGIYNQQYWWRFFVLLQQAFPTLARLFGYRDFNTLIAEPYLLRYPTDDWFLPQLGKDLVKWLEENYHEDDRELILQAARLDWAYEELFQVEQNPPVALFVFSADFYSFRKELLEKEIAYWQNSDLPSLDNSKGEYYSLLYRAKEGIVHEAIDRAQFDLLSSFKNGRAVDLSLESWIEKELFFSLL